MLWSDSPIGPDGYSLERGNVTRGEKDEKGRHEKKREMKIGEGQNSRKLYP